MAAENFVREAHNLYKTLTVFDKKAVLDFKKRFKTREQLEHPSFTVIWVVMCSLRSIQCRSSYRSSVDPRVKTSQGSSPEKDMSLKPSWLPCRRNEERKSLMAAHFNRLFYGPAALVMCLHNFDSVL